MREETKARRQEQIAHAAYELLEQHGYNGISMLKIAKQAKASNETLYKWYGDKKGLFHALVQTNTKDVSTLLQSDAGASRSPLETLDKLGPQLLELLVGSRAVALNRAAAADPTGELGKALAKSGRETIMPLVGGVFERLCEELACPVAQASGFSELYLRLLVGDLQIRRVTGAVSPLSRLAITKRAKEAKDNILLLMQNGGESA